MMNRELFEARQALVYFGQFIAEQLIQSGMSDRKTFAKSLKEFAIQAGRDLAERSGEQDRPNPDLQSIAEALLDGLPPHLELIQGGADNDDGSDAA